MVHPFVLGIYGVSDSGKTVLVAGLVKKLQSDGFKVGTMKRSKERFTWDKEGSDTWRHRVAGADRILFLSPYDSILQIYEEIDELQGVKLLSYEVDLDVILIEGSCHPSIPKVRIGGIDSRKHTVLSCGDSNVEEVYAYVRSQMEETRSSSKVSLQVNGKKISLSEFPEDIILKTMMGMLSSLHGIDTITSFRLEYRK